jgi:hypothetical protein
MSNQFLRKLQELLENRYDDPSFCLRCHVLDCAANLVLLILINRELLHGMWCRHCSYVRVWEIQKLNKRVITLASRGRALSQ